MIRQLSGSGARRCARTGSGPTTRFPVSVSGLARLSEALGRPDERAWERAHEYYLAQFRDFSEIQDERPLPIASWKRGRPDAGAPSRSAPTRVLMTVDAVGGVWRYALELARGLTSAGTEVVLAVMGPPATPEQLAEAAAINGVRVVEGSFDLEWMPGPTTTSCAPALG